MFILKDLGLLILLALFFIISYIFGEKFRSSKIIFKWKVYAQFKDILEGLFYGLLIIVFDLILIAIKNDFLIPIFIIGSITLILIKNTFVASSAFLPGFIYYLIQYPISLLTYITLIWCFIGLIIGEILNFYHFKYLGKTILINSLIFGSFITLIIYDWINYRNLTQISIETLLMPFVGVFIVYSLLFLAINFLISANILYHAINFNFSRYYRQSLREVAIGQQISNQKIQSGFYGIFDFEYQFIGSSEKNLEIKESILLDIEKVFPNQAILFRATQNNYGFFLPFDDSIDWKLALDGNNLKNRTAKDPLFFLEQLVFKRSITYLTSWGQKIAIRIRVGISIYGIQSQSTNVLQENAIFALKNAFNENMSNVQLFNPKFYQQKLQENFELLILDQRIGLDNFVNYYYPIYCLNQKKTLFNFVNVQNVEYSDLKEDARSYINFLDWAKTFDRYMSALSLYKNDQKLTLAFFYSPEILIDNFDLFIFKNKLNKFKLKLNQIVLIFDSYLLKKIKDKQKFMQICKILKKHHLKIAFYNLLYLNANYFQELDPNYLFVSNQELTNKKLKFYQNLNSKIQIVAFELNDDKLFKTAIKQKINLIGGSMFEKNIDSQKLKKKSKMYIETFFQNRELDGSI